MRGLAPSEYSTCNRLMWAIMAKHRRIWSAVGLLLFAVASAHPAWAAGPKRVLLLYHSFAINLIHAKEIRAQLDRQSKDSFEIYDAPLLPPSDENVEDRPG
jgi:hypothetical protein